MNTTIKRKLSTTSVNEDHDGKKPELTKQDLSTHDASDESSPESSSESENEEEQDPIYANKKQKLTSQDIQIARETAELFKSNIFKLQIDELLEQVKLKDKHILRMEKFLHKLYDMIQEIPDWTNKSLVDVENFFHDKIVTVPFADPKPALKNTLYKFGFLKPNVSLIGSFGLKTAIYQPRGSFVDVALTMPSELFEKKDFLNFRALHKKSVYLAYLTHHLNILFEKYGFSDFLELKYKYFDNDPLNPILTIICNPIISNNSKLNEYNFHKSRFSVNLIISIPYDIFDRKKLLPNKNCVRVQDDNITPTPFYNFSILSSTTHEHYLRYLYKTKKLTESFKEASILGRLWLSQRGFSSNISQNGGLGGFGSFEFMILMAALLNGGGVTGNKILLHGFSSYQLFKGTIKYLATMDLSDDGHLQFYSDNSNSISNKYIKGGFNTPTLFDKTTKLNLLSKLTPSAYRVLRLYAVQTYKMLNDVVKDQFENIFLVNTTKLDEIRYDIVLDFKIKSDIASLNSMFGPKEKIRFISLENFTINKISNIITLGLGDRIHGFELETLYNNNANNNNNSRTFPITKRKYQVGFDMVRVKILINPQECEKLVTRGPINGEELTPEVQQFREFWGPKCSLRRFKDGSIVNSCVWSTSATKPVVVSILEYILKHHLGDEVSLQTSDMLKFNELLPLPNIPGANSTSILNLSSFFNLKKSFDELYKILFRMELPLSIKSITPVGNSFRYTTLLQPVPFAYSNPDFLQDVVLEFETSSKWPDELTSLERTKTAFLLKIHEKLEESYADYNSYFARDESIPNNLEIITLNVLTPEGFGFKFRVLTERDEILYLRAISNARYELKAELERTFLKFTSKYLGSIRHTRTIENISHSYHLYSPTVRLFKKWLDSHLLLYHLPEELVELIAMKPFVDADPYFIPGSLENGFLKILKNLSQWNWKEDPLILDLIKPEVVGIAEESDYISHEILTTETTKKLSEKLTLAQYKTIQSNFKTMRKTDPQGLHIQFFVASKNDPSGILYSSGIQLPIATRLTALSKVAVNFIQLHGINDKTIKLLFSPGLKDYDFVFKLKIPMPLRLSSGCSGEFKNLAVDAPMSFPKDCGKIIEKMDPSHHLVKYLAKKYGNSIIFSSHLYVGIHSDRGDENVVSGLIKPLFKQEKLKFRVNMDCNVEPVDEENVKMNIKAVLSEISTFGSSLITDLQINN
ncbi:probable U3 small nucleolar RNA-associated protein 22 [Saccharomycodes ludwigii]|uniref:U3 small nucleolar RNA-associated protein 22 n=1 Tax=Saccharomycodes ludwigii TaxID=36035 RepID=A0A376B4Q5_9ASCO|nr:hypothetical protein SCDLUD_002353 [Saccharomycodes ludwigii]KAH3900894.1 hypothetical protein SCDLUD_002353 [Saccharomycodes ludwigii]SSD59110.1 probable U3 small nucleolar RNA-associated protein 22 [Saccharomycodes ludwigii]